MNAKDITAKVFSKGFNGYKPEEVDDYLKLIAKDMSELQRQSRELERKLETLGDCVVKYRADEDNLKEAMLNAQRQAALITNEAKERGKKLTDEAKIAADKLTAESKAKNDQLLKEGKKRSEQMIADARAVLTEAEQEAARIIDEANSRAQETLSQAQADVKVKHEEIERLKTEADRFYMSLSAAYTAHLEAFANIIPQCESEFISIANAEYKRIKAQDERFAGAYVMRKQDLRKELRSDAAKPAKPVKEAGFAAQKYDRYEKYERYERAASEIRQVSEAAVAEESEEDQDAPLTFDLPFIDIEEGEETAVEVSVETGVIPVIPGLADIDEDQESEAPAAANPAATNETVQFAKPGNSDNAGEHKPREAKREPVPVPDNLFFKKPTGKK
jgi:cell division initiation protein